jgi:Tfp pilus assembly protein PilF
MAKFTPADVSRIAERLKRAKDRARPAHFLVGAGCSISAGIPSAADLIKKIHEDYRAECEALSEAERDSYGACMALLSINERRDLIRPYLSAAKINWGTIALAQLIAGGFVERVLTVNFDLVLENACGLLGLQPAVYDFGVAPASDPAMIVSPAIVHLHGQSYGLVRLNTYEETQGHRAKLQPILVDTLRKAPLVVIGYSGSADGISQNLVDEYEGREPIYWVGYADELANHLHGFLKKNHFHFLGGADFDRFMIELAQSLECWPPSLFSDPLGHLLKGLEPVVSYPVGNSASAIDLLGDLKRKIETWQFKLNQEEGQKRSLRELYMKRDFQGIAESITNRAPVSDEDRDISYWSFIEWGDLLCERAEHVDGGAASRLHATAGEKYQAALKVKRDGYEALNNWGGLLCEQAERASGQQAVQLFAAAREKYEAALAMEPNDLDILRGLADVLFELAGSADGEEAAQLLAAAGEKYRAALAIAPRDAAVLNELGNLLLQQAKNTDDENAARLFEEAETKYQDALAIQPDNDEVLNNWGILLSDRAALASGEDASRLFALAEVKYQAALKIRPNNDNALTNWGNVLAERAERANGEDASRLLGAAAEKYAAALNIEPNNPDALYNWGNLLSEQALRASGEEASQLFAAASQKYEAAVAIQPDASDVLNNWADLLLVQAKRASGGEASRLLAAAKEKLEASLRIEPNDAVVLCSFGELLSEQARWASRDEATRLYREAAEKYAASLKANADYAEALNNWGRSLLEQARRAEGDEALRFLAQATKKLQAAAKIDPADTYGLACLAALRGNERRCREALENGERHGTLPTVEHLASDISLDAMHEKPWFKDLLARQKAKAGL